MPKCSTRSARSAETYEGDRRWRIEHAQIVDPADLPRFAVNGIVASMQPQHATSDWKMAIARMGPERAGRRLCLEDHVEKLGSSRLRVRCAGRSRPIRSWASRPRSPARTPMANRRAAGCPSRSSTSPKRCAPIRWGAAFAGFAETRFGNLAPGQAADFLILDRDISKVPPGATCPQTRVTQVWIGGKPARSTMHHARLPAEPAMTARCLSTKYVEKPWGRDDSPTLFPARRWSPASARSGSTGRRASTRRCSSNISSPASALSIQVHPNDEQGRARGSPGGKSECWLILEADPGATLGMGTLEPLDGDMLRATSLDGRIEQLMDWKPVKAGDFFYIPAGTVHAIGAGIVLVEVQQNVDVTYRLYDYGQAARAPPGGRRRGERSGALCARTGQHRRQGRSRAHRQQ